MEMAKIVYKAQHPGVKDIDKVSIARLKEALNEALRQQGLSADTLIDHLYDSGTNVIDALEDIHKNVAKYCADHEHEHAKDYLSKNVEARGKIEGIVNGALKEHGQALRAGLKQQNIVTHLGAVYEKEGTLDKGYVKKKKTHFKKASGK
jgi:hypothetical protein